MRARREQLGYTLAAVAEEANVSVPYLANLENGRGNPTFNVLTSLANALQAPLHDLVRSSGHEEALLAEETLRLATMPDSLKSYSRSRRFKEQVDRLAQQRKLSYEQMRSTLLTSLAAAPVDMKDDFETRDWDRLLDAYVLVLQGA
jgi:transcriptional regulator with XRE-family HTH domain